MKISKNHTVYLAASVLLVVLAAGLSVNAAPEPAIVPSPSDWTFDVKFRPPELIELQEGRDGQSRRYWYIILTVTNDTGRDAGFFPECEMMTDTFEITPAGSGVSPRVFERIKQLYELEYPFLESLSSADSRMLQGEDNTRDIALIWPDFDTRARNVKFFISGLSNETVAVDHPVAKDEQGRPVKVYLRKTLLLDYKIGGDPRYRAHTRVILNGKDWVMR